MLDVTFKQVKGAPILSTVSIEQIRYSKTGRDRFVVPDPDYIQPTNEKAMGDPDLINELPERYSGGGSEFIAAFKL